LKLSSVCAAAALWGAGLAAFAHPAGSGEPDPAQMPERVALLARAESELARGDTAASLDDFERAAMMLHAPDAEMGLLRAALQDGQYRRALAFCAHTAGAHLEATDASALYAWLLRAGGQPGVADRVLAEARARAPDDAVVGAVADAFAKPLPIASEVLLKLPHRMAPWPVMLAGQQPVPNAARFVAGAVLVGDGSTALAPAESLAKVAAQRLWVRNGLGQTTEATVDRSDKTLSALGVAVLKLGARLDPGPSGAKMPPAAPFAGSPGYIVQFAASGDAAWPWLRQGFFGSNEGAAGLRRLGFSDAGGSSGAAVLDRQGRLVGVSLRAASGEALWMPMALWKAGDEPGAAPAPPTGLPSIVAPDAIYETGMRLALQVVAAD
jgi:hypothetical protein